MFTGRPIIFSDTWSVQLFDGMLTWHILRMSTHTVVYLYISWFESGKKQNKTKLVGF